MQEAGVTKRRTLLALVLVAAVVASPARAADDNRSGLLGSPAEGWSFLFAPYLWIPEVHGSVQVGRLDAPIDVDFDQVFDLMGHGDLLAGMGQFEARHGPISLMLNAIGGTVKPSTERQLTTIDTTLNFTFFEFGPAYRLLDYPTSGPGSIVIEALAGGRFMYFYQEITVTGQGGGRQASRNVTATWVDPFVGGRWSVPLIGELSLFFRGDIGGFGAGSQLAWNLLSGFSYDLSWEPFSTRTSLILGYKAFDFDYQTGTGTRTDALALDMRGPALGLSFQF